MDWNEELEQILRNVLSEENTDALIDAIMEKINFPWWLPSGIIRKTLDQMLPEVLLNAIIGLLPSEEDQPGG